MVVDAAVEGMGAAMGPSRVIAREMERAALVPLFDRQVEAPARCCRYCQVKQFGGILAARYHR